MRWQSYYVTPGNRSQFLFPDAFSGIPSFRTLDSSDAIVIPETSAKPSTLPTVALGGTFDHLHSGHKILLSMAAWIAEKKLIVGITGWRHSPDLHKKDAH